ncbi:hypothetical protein NFC81_11720 [Salinispirillum sp. LH 10-3-1]|uniref:Uncharacterized protein n=1 Tax=Salinispirillum sp. LH 10-3-1 TaxID=2952525 RepID=A0AB38YDG6_9GAMM
MTSYSTASQDWLWDDKKAQPHVRHWPAITKGTVHIHDVTALGALKKLTAAQQNKEAWLNLYRDTVTAEKIEVAVDTLADMIDHNRADCLGDAVNVKGHSATLFALARGEVLTEVSLAARLAMLSNGLATLEHRPEGNARAEALSHYTIADLQLLAAQTDGIKKNQKKADLIKDIVAADDVGELELPLGELVGAPLANEWLEQLVARYVQALHDALADPVYPTVFREAVWRQAKAQANVDALKRALEVEYWDVLEEGIEDTPVDPSEPEPEFVDHTPDWQPTTSTKRNDTPLVWIAVAILFVAWLLIK